MTEVDRYHSSTGNVISLRTHATRWEVANFNTDDEVVWTEAYISGKQPFTEEEARAEFERWRV